MLEPCTAQQTRNVLDYFRSLGDLGKEMNPSSEIGQTLSSTVATMAEMFRLSPAVLLAAHGPDGNLLPVAGHDLDLAHSDSVEVPWSIRKSLTRKSQMRPVQSLPGDFGELLAESVGAWAGQNGSMLMPLIRGSDVLGLFVFDRNGNVPLPTHDSDVLCGMCQNICVYLHNQIVLGRLTEKYREVGELYERVHKTYKQAIMAFLTAIDIKDGYTKEHSFRVANMASVLARDLDFSEHEVEGLYFAGLLHDIGKILVDKEILTKRGSLDLTEYAEMSQHTRLGAQIVENIEFPWENLVHAIAHHHDGPAYEEEFPPHRRRCFDLGTKVIALIDAFDAMTSDRPYRRALSVSESLAEIISCLGTQFDPEITRTFLKSLERDLDRPTQQRRILNDRLLREGLERLRDTLAEALQQVEHLMGVVTTY